MAVPGEPRDLPRAVLFACSLNAVRSPMAAAIMRHLFPGIYVQSAGVNPGTLDPFAVAVMEEVGMDISRHEPHAISDLGDTLFDVIVTLAPEAHHQAMELTRTMAVEVEYWPTIDPSDVTGNREQRLAAYRAIRDQLMARIKERFAWRGAPKV